MHVVDELRSAYPARNITAKLSVPQAVDCDPARISQILSNLLANALTHGSHEHQVHVACFVKDGAFKLSVANSGTPIPPDALLRLFEPFAREDARSSQNALGLGLFIAAEITRAQGGTLAVASDEKETRFTFRMPV